MKKLSVFELLSISCKFECNLSIEISDSIVLNFLFLPFNEQRILKIPIFMKNSSNLPKLKTLLLLKRNEMKIQKTGRLCILYIELNTIQKVSDFIDILSMVYSVPVNFQLIHFNELISVFEKKDFLKIIEDNFKEEKCLKI